MDIKLTPEQEAALKNQLCTGSPRKPLKLVEDMVGQAYFFRTVTYHIVGRVTGILHINGGCALVQLEDASWVASSGRFMQAIKNGTLDEVEPVGPANLNINTVVDFFPWNHPLPSSQK